VGDKCEGLDLSALCAKLDTVVLELPGDGSIQMCSAAADWFQRLDPELESGQTVANLGERFPFLDNFIIDAEEFWNSNSDGRLKSGPWAEATPSGEDLHLEASAICLGSRRVLLIERLGSRYTENQSLLQKAREISLEEQRHVKETQKKEILLHCIVHDLAGPLAGIKGCLSLLKSENLSPKGRELLEAGLGQTVKQEKWIRTILDVFAAEVASIEAFTSDPAQVPDAAICSREVVQALTPAAAADKIQLQLSPAVDLAQSWKVVGEKTRLERVLFNLIENALRHTAPASTVTVGLERDGDQITVMVDDQGPGIPREVAGNLFQKLSQGEGHTGKAGLGLYFCRITVERWGGEIGCYSLPESGARFWFRLPAVSG
jgi:signal transduction histidine kinase